MRLAQCSALWIEEFPGEEGLVWPSCSLPEMREGDGLFLMQSTSPPFGNVKRKDPDD